MNAMSPNAIGSLYMVLGSLAYVLNDAFVRSATEDGLNVYQVICLRGVVMAVLFGAVGMARGEGIQKSHLQRPFLSRVAAEMIATSFFFGALVRMDFANAQAILQIVPFAITLAAVFVLGERVSSRRYVTIAIGFIGVLIVVRPATEGFNAWSLFVVASVVAMVARELATRRVDPATPALSVAFATAVGNTLLGGAISLNSGWGALQSKGLVMIGLASALLFFGYLFTIETVRIGDLSVSAPFRYTVLLGAVVFGYIFFDEVPDAPTIIGSTVIVAAGLYAISLDRAQSPQPLRR
ncbi:MAG: DMT family transporter [Acidimicrobiales bacterium]